MLNVTSATGNGLYISDLYFKSVNNATITNNILFNGVPMPQTPQAQSSSNTNTSSYYLVEPKSGKSVQVAQNE